jgi:hypothetical protein
MKLEALEMHDHLFRYQPNTDGKHQLDLAMGDRKNVEFEFPIVLQHELQAFPLEL